MASIGGYAIPHFILVLVWIVLVVLLVILLALVVHHFGGGTFIVKLGHLSVQIGVN